MEENAFRNLDVRRFVHLNMKCIHYLSYFPLDDEKSRFEKLRYAICATVFIGVAYFLCVSSEVANMVVVFGNMEKMTEASFVLFTNLVHSLKVYCFVFRGQKIRNMVSGMDREDFKPKSWRQYQILLQEIKTIKRITKIFLFMCCVTCLLWAVFPLLDKKPDEKVRLPLSGWYPFDTKESPLFELIYAYQIFATWINGMRNISLDTFITGCIMVISGQLNILNDSFQNLKENQGDVKKLLIQNMTRYKQIIQLAEEVIYHFSTCITGQIVVSVVVICITMFQMSLVSPISLQFFSMTVYQACMLLEIFLWCYYGNEVILQSEKLTISAYTCNWPDFPKHCKADLLFFMTRSQVPLKLYAAGYFTLSLDTFTKILKLAWSYFAVLNTVHSKKFDSLK